MAASLEPCRTLISWDGINGFGSWAGIRSGWIRSVWLCLLFQAGEGQSGDHEHFQPLMSHPCSPQPARVPPSTHRQHRHPRNTPKTGNRAGEVCRRMCSISKWDLGDLSWSNPSTRRVPRALWSGRTCLATATKAEFCSPTCQGRSCAFAKHSVGFGLFSGSGVSPICEPSLILNQQPPVDGGSVPRVWDPSKTTGFCFFTSSIFADFFPPLQTLMGSQGGSLHPAVQDKPSSPSSPSVILGPVWPEKSVFPPRGQALGGAGLRQENLSQFSPVVGKRLTFPWSSSLLIPILSPFSPSCFTFAPAQRISCSISPHNNFCPRSSRVSLMGWGIAHPIR